MAKTKKFKSVEKDAKATPLGDVKELQWEGEEVTAQSSTKIESDQGTGQAIILRSFQFGTNFEAFKKVRPTAQQLFNSHRRGIEALLWSDGMKPFEEVEPRVIFTKDNKFYRFIIACVPSLGNVLTDKTQTLSQLLTKSP